jgi:magnesium-transporting ATPase (P-type)
MIEKANVGIGIFGNEGSQSATTAEFAIHRFNQLHRIVFYYGRIYGTNVNVLMIIGLIYIIPKFFDSFFYFFFAKANQGSDIEYTALLFGKIVPTSMDIFVAYFLMHND